MTASSYLAEEDCAYISANLSIFLAQHVKWLCQQLLIRDMTDVWAALEGKGTVPVQAWEGVCQMPQTALPYSSPPSRQKSGQSKPQETASTVIAA